MFWVLYGFVWSCSVSATCLMHVRSVLLTCNNHGVKIIYLCSTVHGNSHITGIWGKSTRRLAISLGRKTMVQSIATAIATGVVEEALLQIIEPWGHGFQDSKKNYETKTGVVLCLRMWYTPTIPIFMAVSWWKCMNM